MPVFRNESRNVYSLVSYKALYSKFFHATEWKELGLDPTPRLLAKAIVRDHSQTTFFPVRSPFARVVSCFMDKFRKQPLRINEQGFYWQACHKLLFRCCVISDNARDEEIAAKFLDFSFDEFIQELPVIYRLDGHFQLQSWSRKVLIGDSRWVNWPNCMVIKVEDSNDLHQIPGIDWAVKTNATDHIERDFDLLEKHKEVIRKLYRDDFKIGAYSLN